MENPLKKRRLELGLQLDEVSVATRIPVAHLKALEEGRPEDLPAGPYARAYFESYQEYLDVDLDPVHHLAAEHSPAEDVRTPLRTVRWIATGSCVIFLVVLGYQVWELESELRPEIGEPKPDQHVHIITRRNTHIEVVVDGTVKVDRRVAGGESLSVEGHNRVEVMLPATENARIEYNGSVITPQGRQDVPRRLIFIDDLEGE